MVAGLSPNWRHIFIAFFLVLVLWYVFFNSKATPVINLKKPKINKIQVEVYYEVWCPDSKRFIIDQVLPAWNRLNSVIDIHWKPYGKASHIKNKQSSFGYDFDCQHGGMECQGNMIHACSIQYLKNQDLLNKYVFCMMENNRDVKAAGQSCAEKLEVDWQPISKCSENVEGGNLLAAIGDDTNSLKPSVSFIPTVQLNGSQERQKLMLKDLSKAICDMLEGDKPDSCL